MDFFDDMMKREQEWHRQRMNRMHADTMRIINGSSNQSSSNLLLWTSILAMWVAVLSAIGVVTSWRAGQPDPIVIDIQADGTANIRQGEGDEH